jgi:hypothetical protein
MTSLQWDTAWAVKEAIIEIFGGLLREEEKVEAGLLVMEAVAAGLEAYELRVERRLCRLNPGAN